MFNHCMFLLRNLNMAHLLISKVARIVFRIRVRAVKYGYLSGEMDNSLYKKYYFCFSSKTFIILDLEL